MHIESDFNYLAILAAGIVIFILGGVWYSPALFAKPWVRLMDKPPARTSMPLTFLQAFISGLITAYILAFLLHISRQHSALSGAHFGAIAWLGFAGAPSYVTSLFGGERRGLWAINWGYHLVSFIAAGAILGAWH